MFEDLNNRLIIYILYRVVIVDGMHVLQYLRYCNTSGILTPLPCIVVYHCLVVQFLDRTEGQGRKP